MCLVCWPLDILPFFSKRTVLLLSWCNTLLLTLWPYASIKYWVQHVASMKSSMPITSVSVELWLFSFCLVESMMGNPHPKDRPLLECPLIFRWTVKDASTHHFKMLLASVLKKSGDLCVSQMHFIRWVSLAQSSLSGSCTLTVRKKIAIQKSQKNRICNPPERNLASMSSLFWLFLILPLPLRNGLDMRQCIPITWIRWSRWVTTHFLRMRSVLLSSALNSDVTHVVPQSCWISGHAVHIHTHCFRFSTWWFRMVRKPHKSTKKNNRTSLCDMHPITLGS